MSEDSSDNVHQPSAQRVDPRRPHGGWGVSGSLFLGLTTYAVPQILIAFAVPFASELAVSENVKNFLYAGLLQALTIGIVLAFVYGYGLNLRALGLGKFKLQFLGMALVAFIGYFFLSVIISTLVTAAVPVEDAPQELGFSGPQGIENVLIFIALVVLAPLAEELMFRGFIFRGLRRRLPFWATAIITSILFALAHLQLNVGLDVFALSLVLCYLREKTGSLWPSIVLHGIKNTVAYVALFVYGVGA